MNYTEEQKKVLNKSVIVYGDKQIIRAVEEMAELSSALLHYVRGADSITHVAEELADVLIMCEQLTMLLCDKDVKTWIDYKINRLDDRLAD